MQQKPHHRQSGLFKTILSKPVETEKIHPDIRPTELVWRMSLATSRIASRNQILCEAAFSVSSTSWIVELFLLTSTSTPFHRSKTVFRTKKKRKCLNLKNLWNHSIIWADLSLGAVNADLGVGRFDIWPWHSHLSPVVRRFACCF